MYAEAGTFTVGVGDGDTPVPVGTVDGGLFAELLEQRVKSHTIGKFGRVREVEKSLMLRVSFGRVRKAPRRKAGILLDGARIAGWPDGNAILTTLDALRALA